MAKVNDGTVFQVGTYSGNPLSMAAARASFEQVMTDDAYAHLNELNDRIIAKCDAVCQKYDFPGYTVGISSKGCVNFALGKITDYESFIKEQDADLVALAWLYNINRGLIIAPGREEEWTLSITHTDADVDLFVERVRGPRPRRHRLRRSTRTAGRRKRRRPLSSRRGGRPCEAARPFRRLRPAGRVRAAAAAPCPLRRPSRRRRRRPAPRPCRRAAG